jgi:hypothetical protein
LAKFLEGKNWDSFFFVVSSLSKCFGVDGHDVPCDLLINATVFWLLSVSLAEWRRVREAFQTWPIRSLNDPPIQRMRLVHLINIRSALNSIYSEKFLFNVMS